MNKQQLEQLMWKGLGVYQPVKGFDHLTTEQRKTDYNQTLTDILDYCGGVKNKTFLDVGSNYGYFCFELAWRGAQTIGVDSTDRSILICKELSKRYNLPPDNPQFIKSNIVNYLNHTQQKFDYVLIFNVFHHIINWIDEESAWWVLNTCFERSNAVFLAMKPMYGRWTGGKLEIPNHIVNNSIATNYRQYRPLRSRVVYVFW